jgi:hypothetical protein
VSANHNGETCGVKGLSPNISLKFDGLTNAGDFGDYKGKDKKIMNYE